jgi:UDP-N-acetylmuramoylalanine--D-glutamate ligase
VDYYDDSKATNVDAVVRAVAAVSFPVVLILGGRDKGGGYEDLAPVVKDRVRALVLLGEASAAIERELGGIVQSVRTDSMDAAVAAAADLAEAGDTVLLSPACASFDLYDNYAQRGEDFQRAVKQTGKRADGSQADNT